MKYYDFIEHLIKIIHNIDEDKTDIYFYEIYFDYLKKKNETNFLDI